jgi:hypothetical protein
MLKMVNTFHVALDQAISDSSNQVKPVSMFS